MTNKLKMKKLLSVFLLISWCGGALSQSAEEIVRKAHDKQRGESSYGEMSMTIIRPGWQRTIKMKSWSKGKDYFLIYITYPAKEKGQVFLKRGRDMWNWVPSIERTIKLPPSMMSQSWMGSDFTNDDLVEQSSIVNDFEHKLLGKVKVRDKICWKIELIPKPDAPVVWGKIILWITVDSYDIWAAEYYDEDNYLVNVENAYDIKKMGDREIPTRIEIVPVDKKGHKTILEIIDMKFNIPIDESFFSLQNMKRVR